MNRRIRRHFNLSLVKYTLFLQNEQSFKESQSGTKQHEDKNLKSSNKLRWRKTWVQNVKLLSETGSC
ncbi:hypothetical protein M8J75_005778 [Diaphorina citri]|nr:hypothetical protein M8J75_005778 [Diaphorina citri]